MAKREDLDVFKCVFPKFTLATVPDAAQWDGAVIIITDATPNNLAWSDGTNWIAADDGATAA